MNRRTVLIFLVALIVLPIAIFGCKGKVEKAEEPKLETTETVAQESTQAMQSQVFMEPAQTVATETIPPTAAPQIAESVFLR